MGDHHGTIVIQHDGDGRDKNREPRLVEENEEREVGAGPAKGEYNLTDRQFT